MAKEKPKDLLLTLLRCSLPYLKVVQTEGNGKRKAEGFAFDFAEVQPTLSKGSARRAVSKRKAAGFDSHNTESGLFMSFPFLLKAYGLLMAYVQCAFLRMLSPLQHIGSTK